MKLLTDVNVSRHVVARMRAAGLDVTRVPECMDPRATDAAIVAEAARKDQVLISHDQDFSAILAVTAAMRPSLINLRVSIVDAGELASILQAVIEAVAEDLAAGAITITARACTGFRSAEGGRRDAAYVGVEGGLGFTTRLGSRLDSMVRGAEDGRPLVRTRQVPWSCSLGGGARRAGDLDRERRGHRDRLVR